MIKFFKKLFAEQGQRLEIPEAQQPSGEVSYTEGYGEDYSKERGANSDAKLIEREKFNQLMFEITRAIQELQLNGAPDWVSGQTYERCAIVNYGDGAGKNVYVSKIAENKSQPSNTAEWYNLLSEIVKINTLATSTIKGVVKLSDSLTWASGQESGIAATPAAVKAVSEKADTAQRAAVAADQKADTKLGKTETAQNSQRLGGAGLSQFVYGDAGVGTTVINDINIFARSAFFELKTGAAGSPKPTVEVAGITVGNIGQSGAFFQLSGSVYGEIFVRSMPTPSTRPWQQIYTTAFKPTKADVGLGNVQNFTISDSVTLDSSQSYASSKAVKAAYDKAGQAGRGTRTTLFSGVITTESRDIYTNWQDYDRLIFVTYDDERHGIQEITTSALSVIPAGQNFGLPLTNTKYIAYAGIQFLGGVISIKYGADSIRHIFGIKY